MTTAYDRLVRWRDANDRWKEAGGVTSLSLEDADVRVILAERDELLAALRFYANEAAWNQRIPHGFLSLTPAQIDRGMNARSAIAKAEGRTP